jgi:transposase InsO family protein
VAHRSERIALSFLYWSLRRLLELIALRFRSERLLIFGRRQLEVVVHDYAQHYNEHRPHRSLGQRPPLAQPPPVSEPA